MKRYLLLIGCLLLTAAFVMGMGNRAQTGASGAGAIDRSNFNTLGTYPLVKQKATLTFALETESSPKNWETNWFTQFYEDKTNVRINFMQFPLDQYKERVNLAFAAGEKIDFVINYGRFNRTEILRFAQQGVIQRYDHLIDSDTIHMKAGLDKYPGLRESFTLPDGSMYVPPAISNMLHVQYYGKMWVNMTFLQNLNLNIPTTIDEFRNMLIAFRDRDANGNGNPNDEIPFAGAIDATGAKTSTFLMNAFVYDDGENRLYLNNGRVTAAFNQPEFRDGLRYLAQLYSERLIYPDSFVLRRGERQYGNSQKYESIIGAMGNPHHLNLGSRDSGQPARWLEYRPIAPLKGPNGLQITRFDYYGTNESLCGLIPVTATNPALVLRWLDWMYTDEGALIFDQGGKGIGWTDADPGATGNDGSPAVFKPIQPATGQPYYENYRWQLPLPMYRPREWFGMEQEPADMMASDGSGSGRFLYYWTQQNYVPYGAPVSMLLPPLYYSEADVSAIASLAATINTYVEESIARFVTGQMNVDRDWDRYLTELRNMGLERYLSLIQSNYDRSSYAAAARR